MAKTHSRNDSFGYLDGIPVKIGEKFKPPRKITLPLNYQQRNPSEVLSEDYDFNLEKQIIEWTDKRRQIRADKARAKDEKVACQIEQFTRLNSNVGGEKYSDSSDGSPNGSATLPSSGSGDSSEAGVTEAVTEGAVGPEIQPKFSSALLANFEGKDILKPELLEASRMSPAGQEMIAIAEKVNPHGIKLEDFEAESSPFDSVELKTLNDMEELKSVLQGMSVTSPPPSRPHDVIVGASSAIESKLNGTVHYYPGHSHINGVVGEPSLVSHDGSNYPPPSYAELGEAYRNKPTNLHLPPGGLPPFQPYTVTTTTQSSLPRTTFEMGGPGPTYSTYMCTDVSAAPWNLSNSTSLATSFCFSQTSQSPKMIGYLEGDAQYSPGHSVTPLSDASSSSSSGGSLRNARSTPDLLRELGKTSSKHESSKKRHSNLPRPNSVGSMEDMSAADKPVLSPPGFSICSAGDPYSELSVLGQLLVRHMVDMGFPQARASRAVKNLGVNDKKVVEHLCSVQSLVEKGFTPEGAESALYLHDQDEFVAQEHLKLAKQFLDLGFDEESVQRALALHKNDRDKALDYLVS